MAVDGLLSRCRGYGNVYCCQLGKPFYKSFCGSSISPKFGVEVIWYVVPLGWFVNWLVSFCQYRAGKWKRIYQSAN